MNLNELRDRIHNAAREKGWYDTLVSLAALVANIHGEVSELWEAYRQGRLHQPCDKDCGLTCVEEELADILIRTLDTAGYMQIDIAKAVELKLAYNATRPHRHGGKAA